MSLNNDFNKYAGKIINLAEYDRRLREENNAQFSGPFGGIKKAAALAKNIALLPVGLYKTFSQLAQYAKTDKQLQMVYYVTKENEPVFDAAAADIRQAMYGPELGKFSTMQGKDLLNQVGLENLYEDAAEIISSPVFAGAPKVQISRLERALDKCTDYSADVQSGKLIKKVVI